MDVIQRETIENYKPPKFQSEIFPISHLFNELVSLRKRAPDFLNGKPMPQWPAFNMALGGARSGDLIALTGDTGQGKTSFATEWALGLMRSGVKSFLMSLEVSWQHVAARIATRIHKKKFGKFDDHDMGAVFEVLEALPGYYLNINGPQSLTFVSKAIEYAARECGCHFHVLDHFDYLVRPTMPHVETSYVIGSMIRELCAVAKRTESCILLIVHPAKMQDKGIRRREIGMDEMKGSSSIKQEPDAVLSLYRVNDDDGETVVRFQKIRHYEFGKYKNSFVRFEFDPGTLEFVEKSAKPEWGEP